MKKILLPGFLLMLIAAVLICTYFVQTMYQTQSPEAVLIKSFQSSGAKLVNCEVYSYGKINDKQFNVDKIKSLVTYFSKAFGINNTNNPSLNVTENDFIKKIETSGLTADGREVNIIAQLDNHTGPNHQKTVSVSVTGELVCNKLQETVELLKKSYSQYKIKPEINTCVTGNYSGKLSTKQLNNISLRILKDTEARKIEGIRDGNLISVSAYSPIIDNSIRLNGKKINLNLAVRYNSFENKTYIWLATPVIAVEY